MKTFLYIKKDFKNKHLFKIHKNQDHLWETVGQAKVFGLIILTQMPQIFGKVYTSTILLRAHQTFLIFGLT